mgnify:CR=1 FL=1
MIVILAIANHKDELITQLCERYIQRINELFFNKNAVIGDELELIDGRIFERNYTPVFHESKYKGHLWSFEDITLNKNYQKNLLFFRILS